MRKLTRLDDDQTIGDFELISHLADGGFASVYVARWRQHPEQLAAVKELHYSLDEDPESPKRYLSEITSIRKIKSAFIPEYLDHGVHPRHLRGVTGEYPWVATRLIAGLPLDEIIEECGKLPEEMVWHLGAGMVAAIADIHETHTVHRDLKPDNVLVAINGPWIIDLGLTHLIGTKHVKASHWLLGIGLGEYGAPELREGGLAAAGFPADIYSLGTVLLRALTGNGPYGESVNLSTELSSSPDLNDLPAGPLGELIRSCLIREETKRTDLEKLRKKFDSFTGGVGRTAFPDVLPEPVTSMLVKRLRNLAAVTETWGPAELGWGPDLRESAAAPPRKEPVLGRKRKNSPPVAGEARLELVRASPPALPRVASVPPAPTLTEWSVTWTREVEGWICGPLAVHGDMVVVASLDGSVTALSIRDDGTPAAAWAEPVRTGAALHAGPLVIPDGVRRGAAYVGDANGFVHRIDLASGRQDVVLEAGAAIEGTPVSVRGSIPDEGDSAVMVDCLYALTCDGWLHSVNLRTGRSTELYPMGHPATGPLATRFGLIFACADGSVSAIDAISGRREWQLPTNGQVLAAPLELAFRLYVCGTDGVLRQVAIENGRETATAKVGDGVPVHCAPVGNEYRVYLAGGDGVIRAYDVSHPNRDRLRPLWERNVDHEVTGLAATPTRVYASAGHQLVELDGETGHPTREPFSMDSLIGAAPVISGQNCYVGSLGGVVTCLSLAHQ